MPPQRFWAYGLLIESELEIPEMLAVDSSDSSASPDVTVRVGTVPRFLADPLSSTDAFEASKVEMLLRIDGVAHYLVSGGREIVVAPDPAASDHDVRVFLLGTCFGALLHQRGALVLHASGMGTPTGAVLFAGPSGAGKSTLLAEMLRRGFEMMVDDVCGIFATDEQDRLVVQPSYPRTRMWADTADQMGIETEGLQRTRSHMDKYERQLPDHFWAEPAPIRRIYHLAVGPGDEMSLTPVPPMVVIPLIVNSTYRRVFLDGFDIREHHFDLASRIARLVPVVHVVRPADTFRLAELADLILDDLADE